jgi:GT2 family glycosyltransferase
MMMAPLVIAVVLNWNRRDDTLACVASLLRSTYEPLHVLVCDNGSVDDTPAAVRSVYPSVEVLELGYNRGFAGGANAGLRHALAVGAEYVLALNNDTFVEPAMIERLVEATAFDVGIVAPLIYYASAPDTIWSAGGLRSRWTLEQIYDLRGQCDPGTWPPVLARDFVPGCAMLISRTILESVGLFDERFFMYYEDSDLCLRVRQAGYRILLVPGAKMWHKVAASSGGSDSPSERYAMARSSVLFFRKHVRGWQWLIITFYRIGSALKTTIRLLRYRKVVAATAYWRGLLAGIASLRK